MRIARWSVVLLAGAVVAIQLVPYGRHHADPPVAQEAPWANVQDRRLAVRACYDCHSNETKWPWYSSVAPVSWFVQNHVDNGRRALNFSTWGTPQEIEDLAGTVAGGSMPPDSYLVLHPTARLSSAEKQRLAAALAALPPPAGSRGPSRE